MACQRGDRGNLGIGSAQMYRKPTRCQACARRWEQKDKSDLPLSSMSLQPWGIKNRKVQLCLSKAAFSIKRLKCPEDWALYQGTTYTLGEHFLCPTLPLSCNYGAGDHKLSWKSIFSMHYCFHIPEAHGGFHHPFSFHPLKEFLQSRYSV